MGDAELINSFREKLAANLTDFESKLNEAVESFSQAVERYSDTIEKTFPADKIINDLDLWNAHRDARNDAIKLVRRAFFETFLIFTILMNFPSEPKKQSCYLYVLLKIL